jgi:hypothetical protein
MKSGTILATMFLAFAMSGCSRVYETIDMTPDGHEVQFKGIRDYLEDTESLHVLQTHGMGDNSAEDFCGERGENIVLQAEIIRRLGLQALPTNTAAKTTAIVVGRTRVGSYSTRVYVDDLLQPRRSLYFSCLTWGDASREIKLRMLELDKNFLEKNHHEERRARINRHAKKFVNESFSDPMIYAGPFGQLIREGVWQGIVGVEEEQRRNYARVAKLDDDATLAHRSAFLEQMPTVVISDSLGSRVLFDTLWTKEIGKLEGDERDIAVTPEVRALRVGTRRQIRGIFMLANQLPLLALAQMPPPPPDVSLDRWLDRRPCVVPRDPTRRAGDPLTTVVAMTDVNDALSYHLSEDFKLRCAGTGVRFVNVTLTNAKPWLFGTYANLLKAHSSGFKTNPKAIAYMVDGN